MGSDQIFMIFTAGWFIFIAIVIIWAYRRRKASVTSVGQELGMDGLASGKRSKARLGDIEYEYRYFSGSRDSPSFFKLFVPMVSNGDFDLGCENKLDRFFRRIGIALEIQTGDPVFDEGVYIKANTVEFAGAYFSDAHKREAVLKLFDAGFNALKHDGKVLELTWTRVDLKNDITRPLVEDAVRRLNALARKLPEYYPEPMMGASAWKTKRAVIVVTVVAAILAAVASMVFGTIKYPPLDAFEVFLRSLKFSVPAFLAFFMLSVNALKGRSSSHHELIGVFFVTLIAYPFMGHGATMVINGATDTSKAVAHRAPVINKWIDRGDDSTTYYVSVQSWRPGRVKEDFSLSWSEYGALTVVESVMEIVTKSGALGFEWVVSKGKLR